MGALPVTWQTRDMGELRDIGLKNASRGSGEKQSMKLYHSRVLPGNLAIGSMFTFARKLAFPLFPALSALWLAATAFPATAQALAAAGGPQPVVELYNTYLGHYFMTRDAAELADIDAGKAGPGWIRTGWYFN